MAAPLHIGCSPKSTPHPKIVLWPDGDWGPAPAAYAGLPCLTTAGAAGDQRVGWEYTPEPQGWWQRTRKS